MISRPGPADFDILSVGIANGVRVFAPKPLCRAGSFFSASLVTDSQNSTSSGPIRTVEGIWLSWATLAPAMLKQVGRIDKVVQVAEIANRCRDRLMAGLPRLMTSQKSKLARTHLRI